MGETALRAVEEARDAFLCSGALPDDMATVVRPEIVASWLRSLRFGAESGIAELPFDRESHSDTQLRRTATPILAALAQTLGDEDVTVLLCDHSSRILDRWSGSRELRRQLDAIHASPGFALDESVVGTNGVGTALQEGRPSLITGAEHFADRLRGFACAGAPIRHPVTRRLLGVVDLTCPPERVSGLLMALARDAAANVEAALLEERSRRDRLLVAEFRSVLSRSDRAVVVIADDVYLQNRRAANLLEVGDQALLGRYAEQLCLRGCPEEERHFTLASGAVAVARIRRLLSGGEGGEAVGILIELSGVTEPPAKRTTVRAPAAEQVRSASGAALAREAQAGMTSTLPLLVLGESGSGKLELLRRMHPERRVAVFDGALEPLGGLVMWLGPVQVSLTDPEVLTVIRRIDGLSTAAARALAALLETVSPESTRQVAATLVSTKGAGAVRTLIDQFPLQLQVPALRERIEDIPVLVSQMVADQGGSESQRWTPEVLRALCSYDWPGNLRQLRGVVQAITTYGRRGDLTVADLPTEIRHAVRRGPCTRLEQAERNAIVEALKAADGNRTAAAKSLGIGRATLYRKIDRFGIDP